MVAAIEDVVEKGYWRLERERDNRGGSLADFVGSVNADYLYSNEPQEQGCMRVLMRWIDHVIPHVAMLFRSFAVQITLGKTMELYFQLADDQDFTFCESLSRRNMTDYLVARGIPWDSSRFRASWAEFENLLILADTQVVGLLRLLPEGDALGLRDLQVTPEHQSRGIGSWAVQQAQSIAANRGFRRLQLRVYEENPAKALYARSGFKAESIIGGTVHMSCELLPNHSIQPTPASGRG